MNRHQADRWGMSDRARLAFDEKKSRFRDEPVNTLLIRNSGGNLQGDQEMPGDNHTYSLAVSSGIVPSHPRLEGPKYNQCNLVYPTRFYASAYAPAPLGVTKPR